MHRLLTLFCLLAFTVLNVNAKVWTPSDLPMVHLQDARRYVCNPDGVMTQEAVDSTDRMLYRLEQDKGVETVVVAVEHLEGDDPYQFGMELARKYGIGSKKQNTGLIIILATEDRSYQILTGEGLEGSLPDAICRRIENRVMVPLLKKQEWGPAIVSTVSAIDDYLRGDETLQKDMDDEEDEDAIVALLIGLSIMGGLAVFFMAVSYYRNRCPRCKTRMKAVKTVRVRLPGSPYHIWQVRFRCPKCGYEKVETIDNNNSNNSGGLPPIIGGGRSGGGSFGGSFGGGSFGGGGAGGRF